MFEKSVLLVKANKVIVEQIFALPVQDQFTAYQATLRELESFLDTGDLTVITSETMNVIKTDVLNIMTGLKQVKINIRSKYLSMLGQWMKS